MPGGRVVRHTKQGRDGGLVGARRGQAGGSPLWSGVPK